MNPLARQAVRTFSDQGRAPFGDRLQTIHVFASKARGGEPRPWMSTPSSYWRPLTGTRRRIIRAPSTILGETGVLISDKPLTIDQLVVMQRRRRMFPQSITADFVALRQPPVLRKLLT